jgi:hypothetical protein
MLQRTKLLPSNLRAFLGRTTYVQVFFCSLALAPLDFSQPVYMLILSDELRNENSQIHTRNAASLALNNALSARVSKHVLRDLL